MPAFSSLLLPIATLLPVQDSSPGTPIFVFLSPGVDVAGSVEALGRKLGFTSEPCCTSPPGHAALR